MTREEVEKLLELESKSTPGPWEIEYEECSCLSWRCNHPPFPSWLGPISIEDPTNLDDFIYLKESRNLIRPLCLDWLRLKEENEKMLSLFAIAELEKDLEK